MASIYKIHQQLIKCLITVRKSDTELFFMPRKINNAGRLSSGYWFLGSEGYVYVNLWEGMDWKERVGCIGFVVLNDKSSYIELSAQDPPEVVPFLKKLAEAEGGFYKHAHKNKWYKEFDGTDYLEHFKYFIDVFKPRVDALIDSEKPPHITKISADSFERYGKRVISLYEQRLAHGRIHKITRLSWNANNWRYPSGWAGKSKNLGTHEGKYGFGFEEWLFDYSKVIGGYMYGFIKGFESINAIHAGKVYQTQLYTQNSSRMYFHLGYIDHLEGISHEKSSEIYLLYESRGWLEEMIASLERVHAKLQGFAVAGPTSFFNVRFKVKDVNLFDEMTQIANVEDIVPTDRFKLLSYHDNAAAVENVPLPEEPGHEGNWKNTGRVKRTFNPEQEFDPYHNHLQNKLVQLLRDDISYGYTKVDIEKSRVDVKAFTADGACHYFEIKTASPKQNVRQALGQVMEYAYFPDQEMAKKLYVVGDQAPDERLTAYLIYLRERFEIPVFYRHFDVETLVLSEEY